MFSCRRSQKVLNKSIRWNVIKILLGIFVKRRKSTQFLSLRFLVIVFMVCLDFFFFDLAEWIVVKVLHGFIDFFSLSSLSMVKSSENRRCRNRSCDFFTRFCRKLLNTYVFCFLTFFSPLLPLKSSQTSIFWSILSQEVDWCDYSRALGNVSSPATAELFWPLTRSHRVLHRLYPAVLVSELHQSTANQSVDAILLKSAQLLLWT